MKQDSHLEQYVEYALSGAPEIKGQEKRYWLGEFRERVIFAIKQEHIGRRETLKILEDKIQNPKVEKMVVRSDIQSHVAGKLMELCQRYRKDYKTMSSPDLKGEVALILASTDAVNEEEVFLDPFPLLPDSFYHAKTKRLCKDHMAELKEIAPQFVDEFQELSFFDKMTGIRCGVCEDTTKNGVMT